MFLGSARWRKEKKEHKDNKEQKEKKEAKEAKDGDQLEDKLEDPSKIICILHAVDTTTLCRFVVCLQQGCG